MGDPGGPKGRGIRRGVLPPGGLPPRQGVLPPAKGGGGVILYKYLNGLLSSAARSKIGEPSAADGQPAIPSGDMRADGSKAESTQTTWYGFIIRNNALGI